MAREVAEALKRIYVKVGKMTMEEAEAMIQNIKVTERSDGHKQCVKIRFNHYSNFKMNYLELLYICCFLK